MTAKFGAFAFVSLCLSVSLPVSVPAAVPLFPGRGTTRPLGRRLLGRRCSSGSLAAARCQPSGGALFQLLLLLLFLPLFVVDAASGLVALCLVAAAAAFAASPGRRRRRISCGHHYPFLTWDDSCQLNYLCLNVIGKLIPWNQFCPGTMLCFNQQFPKYPLTCID